MTAGTSGSLVCFPGKSGLLSSFEGHLGIPQEVLQWNRASFHIQGVMS